MIEALIVLKIVSQILSISLQSLLTFWPQECLPLHHQPPSQKAAATFLSSISNHHKARTLNYFCQWSTPYISSDLQTSPFLAATICSRQPFHCASSSEHPFVLVHSTNAWPLAPPTDSLSRRRRSVCIYVYVCVCAYLCMYVYMYGERERENTIDCSSLECSREACAVQ